MAISKYKIEISRLYEVDVDMPIEKDIEIDYLYQQALSQFNNDLQFGLISANKDDFKCEIKYDWIE